RLPGAVRPEEAEHLAGLDAERDAVDRDDRPESFADLVDLDHWTSVARLGGDGRRRPSGTDWDAPAAAGAPSGTPGRGGPATGGTRAGPRQGPAASDGDGPVGTGPRGDGRRWTSGRETPGRARNRPADPRPARSAASRAAGGAPRLVHRMRSSPDGRLRRRRG